SGLEANPDAAAGQLHASGVGLQQLAVHHLGDQLGAVEAGPVVRICHPLGEDAGAELAKRPVRQLDRLEAARTQLAADRAAEVDLHRFSILGTVFRLGHSPTISITIPSTGSNGRTMPPRRAL